MNKPALTAAILHAENTIATAQALVAILAEPADTPEAKDAQTRRLTQRIVEGEVRRAEIEAAWMTQIAPRGAGS